LNIDKVLRLQAQCNELSLRGLGSHLFVISSVNFTFSLFAASFGIGTFLTNDFRTASSDYTAKSKALNIVIKLSGVENLPCVKISDDLTKVPYALPETSHVISSVL